MKSMLHRLSLIALLLSVIHLPASASQSSDETALRSLAQKYTEAYEKEDFESMMVVWSLRSKDMASSFEKYQEAFTAGDYAFSNVIVSGIKVEGNRAIIQITADLAVKSPSEETRSERFARNFALIREGGVWKIWWDVPASQNIEDFLKKGSEWKTSTTLPLEEQFASALIDTNAEDRRALLAENREMITPDLLKTLIKKAESFRSPTLTPKAIEAYRLVLSLGERINDKRSVAFAHLGMAAINRAADSNAQAIERYEKALALFEELGDKSRAADIHREIAKTHLDQRQYQKALDSYNRALSVCEALRDRVKIADALENIGGVYYAQQKYAEAIGFYEKSLSLRESLGRKAEVAVTLRYIGDALYYQENHEAAIDRYLKAVAGFEAVKDAPAIADTMHYLGSAHFALGNYDSALECYQKALAFEEGFRDRRGAASSLFGIGSSYYALGDFAAALRFFYRNLSILESLGNKAAIPDTLRRIGLAHLRHYNYAAAREAYERCLALYEERGDKLNVALLIIDIGNIHYAERSYDAAIERYRAALSHFESLQKVEGIAASYTGIASVYYAQRAYDLALEFYQKGFSLYELLGEKELMANTLESMAGVNYARGDYAKSLELAERSSAMAREAKSNEVLWQARFTAGIAHRALNQMDEARKALEESIAVVEAMRAQLIDGLQGQPFFKDKNAPYIEMMELLLTQNDTLGAFAFAEAARQNSLWDMLRGVRLRITRTMTPAEQNRERQLMKALVTLARQFERQKQLSNPVVSLPRQLERDKENQQRSDARLSLLEARLQKVRQEYEAFKKKLYTLHPQLKSLRGETPPLKVEETARLLDSRSALLIFAMSETKTCLFVLTLERTGGRQAVKLKVYILNLGRTEMANRVARFRSLIEQRSEQLRESARELYDLLLAGASSQLSGKDLIVIAPDSVLWGLPFQALQSADNRYLIEDAAIVYAPSLTAYREMTRPVVRRAVREQLLAFGDPVLGEETLTRVGQLSRDKNFDARTENENELKTLTGIYGAQLSRVYTGADASEERLKAEGTQSRILQLSVRAVLSDANPLHSAVLLSQNHKEDGMLQPWEIISLNLKSDMVVISDCEMASAEAMSGDAMTGLAWGWLVAGCPTVFLSQWKSDSEPSDLLTELHRNLKGRLAPAKSLRQSALKMLKGDRAHPFYWSRLIIVGRGR